MAIKPPAAYFSMTPLDWHTGPVSRHVIRPSSQRNLSAYGHFEPKTVQSQTQDTSAPIPNISALRHIDPNAETLGQHA